MDEIINRVQESGLIPMDLADFKPKTEIVEIDVANQLWEGLILREKDFRAWIKENDWKSYEGKAVFIHCSADAIVPTWAFMLVASKLVGITPSFIVGSKIDLEKELIKSEIAKIKLDEFHDGKIIIKGCSDIAAPEFAMSELLKHLQPVAKSIMYGEPCSTVPIFKKAKV
ncbi:MAG: hypothetical protein RI922_1999 [Bacteroidota bacterium]|jgi:hypothetical protein